MEMSAGEIIEQITCLSPTEQQKVANFVREQSEGNPENRAAEERPDFDQIAKGVFDQDDELFQKLAQ